MSKTAFILLGSNIDPISNMQQAIQHLKDNCDLTGISKFYESQPVKKAHVPRYINAVVSIQTDLNPVEIKHEWLRSIESIMGRVRTDDKYKSRVIDLDLIMWGKEIYTNYEEDLILPDPEIVQFGHVALPLADLAPDLMHPVHGISMSTVAEQFSDDPSIRPLDLQVN